MYGYLHEFQCLLDDEVKFALFTATATKQTKCKIMNMLNINEAETLFIEKNPERENIRYCAEYVENDKEVCYIFNTTIRELQEKKELCPRRLIYTQTRKQCARIYNSFCSELGDKLYLNSEPNLKCRLVEMFHGGTPETVKQHIVMQLGNSGSCLRVVICTVAFGMGVNCTNVHESVHFGSPKSVECYVQESGRIGRDGADSISRILYNEKLLKGASHQMVSFIKGSYCRRQGLMKYFEHFEEKELQGCNFCDNCAKLCQCSEFCCNWISMVYDTLKLSNSVTPTHGRERIVSVEQKTELHRLLTEFKRKLTEDATVSLSSVHNEFYSYHISQVLANCVNICLTWMIFIIMLRFGGRFMPITYCQF